MFTISLINIKFDEYNLEIIGSKSENSWGKLKEDQTKILSKNILNLYEENLN